MLSPEIAGLRQKIVNLFTNKKSSTITTLFTKTRPKLKSGHPYKNLVKISRVNCVVNNDYSKAMQKLGKIVDERRWGKKLSHSVVTHNGANYLQIRPLKSHSIYLDGVKQVPFDEVKFYLPEFSDSQDVPVRTYRVDNIIGLLYEKKLYTVEGSEKEVQLVTQSASA